jgi:hypothetical protein
MIAFTKCGVDRYGIAFDHLVEIFNLFLSELRSLRFMNEEEIVYTVVSQLLLISITY